MKITVLIENTTKNNLTCEHGLSLWIEHEDYKVLLDAGSTAAFYENAKELGIDIKTADAYVLSHGHYDHSGGFSKLLGKKTEAKIYMQKGAAEKYHSGKGGMHPIGIPDDVLAYKNKFIFVEGVYQIKKDVYLVGHSTEGLERIGEKSKLYKEINGEIIPDDFSHEQSLVFHTEKGLVIFNSCSHGGVECVIREVKVACENKQVYAYIGGLHMKGEKNGTEICTFTDDELAALCETIRQEKIKYVYTGHCTGKAGLQELQRRLGDVVCGMTTGMEFTL